MGARRQRSLYPRNAHLPLPRPFHVRSGEISHARGGGEDAHRARPDRAGARALVAEEMGERGRTEEDRRGRARHRQRGGRVRDQRSRARSIRAVDRRVCRLGRLRRTFIALRDEAPMPIQVLMPALSPTMEKGNLAKWVKKEGEPVKAGDVIAEIETDKATMEVEAADEGTLGKILVPEGTADVAVNTPIAMILAEGEDKGSITTAKPVQQQKAPGSAPPTKTQKEQA